MRGRIGEIFPPNIVISDTKPLLAPVSPDHTLCSRLFDYPAFLRSTRRLHTHVCHICLDATRSTIRLTIPSISGKTVVLPLLEELVETAQRCLRPDFSHRNFANFDAEVSASRSAVDKIALEWPEYVLGPTNPLTFLDPSMPCKFFPQV